MDVNLVAKQLQAALHTQLEVDPVQVPQALAGKFEGMMQPQVATAPVSSPDETSSMISDLVTNEDQAYQYVSNDLVFMMNNVDSMSANQLTTAAMQIQLETASLQVDMQVKMSVVTSSKDAIETLMKNQ